MFRDGVRVYYNCKTNKLAKVYGLVLQKEPKTYFAKSKFILL